MPQTTPIQLPVNFFAQLLVRLGQKTPKFFVYIRAASVVVGAVSALFKYMGTTAVPLPTWLQWVPDAATQVGAILAVTISSLAVEPSEAMTQNTATKLGVAIKKAA